MMVNELDNLLCIQESYTLNVNEMLDMKDIILNNLAGTILFLRRHEELFQTWTLLISVITFLLIVARRLVKQILLQACPWYLLILSVLRMDDRSNCIILREDEIIYQILFIIDFVVHVTHLLGHHKALIIEIVIEYVLPWGTTSSALIEILE